MDPALVILIAIGLPILLVLIWLIGTYNSLVRGRNTTDESWSGIDTELNRRYDLIPNLVETVKGYAAHERQTLEAVVEARNRAVASHGSPSEQARDENVLVGTLNRLLAVIENYPDLKANTNFLYLQQELVNTEDRIQAARRFYNANVRELNTRVEAFPSNIIAGMFGFTRREFFEVDSPAIRQAPQVSLTPPSPPPPA